MPLEDETSSESSAEERTDSQSITSSEEDDSDEWKEEGADELEKNESKVESTEVEAAVSAAQTRAEMGASITSKMKTVFPGDGENFPTEKDIIRVHYTARIIGRTELLESTRDRGSAFEFRLGRGEVIRGWEECIPLMSVGQECIINCPPEVCYGEKGVMPVIPPNASFEFDIQLISFRSQPAKTSYELRVYQEGDDPEDEEATPRSGSEEDVDASESTDSDPIDSDDSDFKRMNLVDASPTSADTPTNAEAEAKNDDDGADSDSDSFEGVGDEDMDVSQFEYKG